MQAAAFTHEVEQEEGRAVLIGEAALGREVDGVARVGEGGVPPREAGAVVELVVDVPAEHAVTEARAVVDDGGKLVEAHVFSAVHAVDVGEGELDALDA